ncbi:ABC transporter ATP-binding protein [Herbiconiux sp. CPCC 203407]|uniref:ABC transporter ATP-binding protein n=1 Tax=Herbiconiux oxytropis TaxID=2970915 RepID=A0AA41XI36_9MICO|nr:ABC transporter ATP-binding protein [Herbiconiux oxytropis]MCS5721638.1 ABC transporter ATP-binding protein [Herbiconiux oxytropis]MCS5726735.1 ABC transporter ATP-binding protein [Herbiconiux oxytropis]
MGPLAELRGITKTFGAVVANDSIDLRVLPGEVLALLGENGAGKSTLTRILYGLSQADSGSILVDGTEIRMHGPADAMAAGIGMVTQEFSLVDTMTVTENLMLAGSGLGRVNRSAAKTKVLEAAARIGVAIEPDAVVGTLSVGERQRVEIVKALFHDCRLLILDEPTAVLVPQDVAVLFESIRRLTADGMGVIFISHKLHEVVEIADRVSILRRGRIVADVPAEGLVPAQIAAMMVGSADRVTEPEAGSAADTVEAEALATAVGLEVPGAGVEQPVAQVSRSGVLDIDRITLAGTGKPLLDEVSLTVHAGEIVGVAGVSGNGQTELVSVLCGMTPASSGAVRVDGADITRLDVTKRLRAGLGRLTEDRRGSVVLNLSVEQNLVLEDLDRFRTGPFTSRRRIKEHVAGLMERFDIRAKPGDPIRSLSGGNMQKVLLARAIAREPKALVASQPTRGLDVGACEYVYSQLRALRERGAGVLVISEDLDELLGLCDRIVVMVSGRIVGEVLAAGTSREELGLLMTGMTAGAGAHS